MPPSETGGRVLERALRTPDFEAKAGWLNGSPAARIDIGGDLDTAVSLSFEDGRITAYTPSATGTSWLAWTGSPPLTRT